MCGRRPTHIRSSLRFDTPVGGRSENREEPGTHDAVAAVVAVSWTVTGLPLGGAGTTAPQHYTPVPDKLFLLGLEKLGSGGMLFFADLPATSPNPSSLS